MGVTVKGELDACVSEQMLHQLWVYAMAKQQGSACVPKIVPPDRGEVSTIQQWLEVPVDDVLGVERCALRGGEHESLPVR